MSKRVNRNLPIPDGYHLGRLYSKNGIDSMKKKLSARMKGNTYGKGRIGSLSPSYKYIEKQVIDSIINNYKYIKDGIKDYGITLYTFNRAYEEYYGHKFKDRNKK